ncbi:hypothetical protein RSOL_161060 [Rhizoctonia solani AG-3 Rhs1AP]|uniref:Uncharacterized protein n=1 Tax=Rhizoctonia solani AG-3 Rhs1AP TaxID=1086054 RepID=X8J2I1_9AGAM|nr:hypothetical protein RSOL_161060 [Rhizoctonia solani AG-3 Rhs1AP]
MSDDERSSESESGAPTPPKPAAKSNPAAARPKSSRSGKSTVSSKSKYTITVKGVKLTRLAQITDADELSPTVSALPTLVAGQRAQFWHQWIGKDFKDKIGSRGSGGENGRNWLFKTFVTSYCDEFHPELTAAERCEYEAYYAHKVYYYMHNCTNRDSRPHAESDDEGKNSDPTRVCAADIWAKDKPKEYQKKLEAYYAENPGTKENPGLRRSARFKIYATLSDAEQKRYQKMANDAMARIKNGQELEGEEAEKYSKQLPQNLKKILDKAEKAVGAQALVLLMTKESLTKMNITILSSNGFQDFSKSAHTTKLVTSLKGHVEQTPANASKPSNYPPRPRIYPDRKCNNKPSVPDLTGLQGSDLHDLHRDYWKQTLIFTGGGSRFPWEEIAKNPAHWLGGKLPGDFKDPGYHNRDGNFAWLECILAGQKDDIPPADRIFIRRIHAADPIDPSESEEVGRERVTHQGREVWELTFNKPVTKCHAKNAMTWPDESLLYADYIQAGPIAGSYSNSHQLPLCPDTKTHLTLIGGELYEEIATRADQLADGKDDVLELVASYNEFASHLPAETVKGAWAGKPVPLLFSTKPPKQAPTSDFFLRVYLPSSYYQSTIQARQEGTLAYFEMWIDLVLSGELLSHGPSSTLLGGITGCIWPVLGVVLILFNLAYVRRDAKAPFDPPEDYDLSRLPASEWDRVREWCRQLTEVLKESTRVLSQTSPYRLRGALPMPTTPAEDPTQTDLPDTNAAPAQTPPASPEPAKKSNRRNSTRNKAKGKEPQRAQATESESEGEYGSDRDSDSTDYDKKDESDEDPSEDESQPDVDGGVHGLGVGDGNAKTIRHLLPKSFHPRECPWGDFPDPKIRVELPTYITPETLIPPMESAYDELNAALQDWHRNTIEANNLHVGRLFGTSERNNPVLSDPRIGPMYATILTREMIWNISKAQGKLLYPILDRLQLACASGVQYSKAWTALIDSNKFLEGEGHDLGELDKIGMRLRVKIAEATWTYREMLDYAHLSTAMGKWMNWLPETEQRPAPDSSDIRKYAIWCVEWAKATEELEGQMMYYRRECWRTTGRPFDKQFSKLSRYKFGNAVKEEWHQGFEACLALDVDSVSNSTPTTPVAASNPDVNVGTSDESAAARHEKEPTADGMEEDQQESAMTKEPEPDQPTQPATSPSGPDASCSTAGKAATSTSKKRGRKPAPTQQDMVIARRQTRGDAKRKAEEAQQPIRKSQRKK